MQYNRSEMLFDEAKRFIPGGVNSPVRAFKSVGLVPPFIKSAKGSKIYDEDGNEYIDYVGSWGPMILGHAHERVINAITAVAEKGTSFGAPIEAEIKLARLICELIPSIELVRMVNSGTEATMSAIRLARGYTGRNKIIKFEGCYHGHSDSLLIKAGSGALTFGVPDSPGVPADFAKHTLSASYNNLEEVKQLFEKFGEEIAAVIIEPVAGNMGVVVPEGGFLKGLRDITTQYGALLIFDEVMTGFRVSLQCAQGLYNITPDLTTFGKIIGGGLPVGAYGGKREIMEKVSPVGPVYQAGTLSGNPIAMAAGLETLTMLKENPSIYEELERKSKQLEEGLKEHIGQLALPMSFNRVGSMLCMFFTGEKVKDYKSAVTSDTQKFARYFRNMLQTGIYIAPSQYEAMFVSIAHTDEDIEKTIEASYGALKNI
ncbi:glutamate-1-semialdehyde 2,1-aminomutase [Petroclostridium sp. X23]|uniref:glutamate-1-semialdehyde 2,1-aminomutase n=1 Tax=Petroclostridium sp. X23 TaxID=3045146 RepID=UPI0024ACE987|nr:glutamate-1-semialdehyde 2,1-aminomutase [Petroclostridium sp. X23]WHH59214.1 glutamate-1-semialdehyde 2,1-aminomutase [Petroclostridium sp. X23]